MFAATASTIVSGAVAERVEFIAYMTYAAAFSGVIFPVITHWAWDVQGGGWLTSLIDGVGFKDFAGAAVVHLHGGVSAWVGAYVIGPRIGRWDGDGRDLRGHSVPVSAKSLTA